MNHHNYWRTLFRGVPTLSECTKRVQQEQAPSKADGQQKSNYAIDKNGNMLFRRSVNLSDKL